MSRPEERTVRFTQAAFEEVCGGKERPGLWIGALKLRKRHKRLFPRALSVRKTGTCLKNSNMLGSEGFWLPASCFFRGRPPLLGLSENVNKRLNTLQGLFELIIGKEFIAIRDPRQFLPTFEDEPSKIQCWV